MLRWCLSVGLLLALFGCGASSIGLDGGALEVGDAASDAGPSADAGVWPPPFVPSAEVVVRVDPALTAGEGCQLRCDPSPRAALPRTLNVCELGGLSSAASGPCSGDTCTAPEICQVDEFSFGQTYCARDGLPRGYCGAYTDATTALVAISARVTHRLTGAVLVLRLQRVQAGPPLVQVYLQEGYDELDDQGRPYPLPELLSPASGELTLSSSDLDPGQTLSGSYALQFKTVGLERTIQGTFRHIIH
ncbi:MAG: hypothetical protein U1E65_01685 [Myxococcota bacterium]